MPGAGRDATGRRSRPLVSVIIPVYNDASRLQTCLRSLREQTCDPSVFEVIVADNGSTSPVRRSELPELDTRVEIVREARPGSYVARNTGVGSSEGSVLAFTDADCRPAPDWIERGLVAVRRLAGDGLIGGRIDIVPADREAPTPAELYEMALVMVQQDLVQRAGMAATANMWTTRETFDHVGQFDASLLSGGDAEWARRVILQGGELSYSDDVVVRHPARRSVRALYRKQRRVRSGAVGAQAPAGPSRRSWSARVKRFRARTDGWPARDRVLAGAVALMMELANPVAAADLRFRRHERL